MHVFSCKILQDISYKIIQELPCKITKEFGTYPGVILPYLYMQDHVIIFLQGLPYKIIQEPPCKI